MRGLRDFRLGQTTMAVKKFLDAVGRGGQRAPSLALVPDTFMNFPGAMLVIDAAGRVIAANPPARPFAEAVEQERAPAVGAAVARALATGAGLAEAVMVPGTVGASLHEITVLPLAEGAALVLAKDVTLESNLRSTLIESRQRYRDLVEVSSDFAWETGPDGSFVFVSPKGALGHTADQLVDHMPADFIVDQPGVDGLKPFRSDQPVENAEVWMRRADGHIACLAASSSPLLDAEGRRRGARGVCRDVTKERERDAALARANNRERLLAYIVRTIRDVVEPSDMLTAAGEAVSRALGGTGCQIFRHRDGRYVSAAVHGTPGEAGSVLAALAEHDAFDGQVEGRPVVAAVTRYRKDINGAIMIWREAEALPWSEDERILLGEVANQIGIANEQITNHERILLLSRTDGLTGLFNRRAFLEELSRRFTRLAREKKPAALIYADLDNFKLVNDMHGHQRGDEALLAVRDILLGHSRPNDLIARLGGDEFAVWLEGADERIAVQRCRTIIEAGCALARFSGKPEAPLTMSLGVAVHDPGRPETLNHLLSRADEAMYDVKRGGKSDFRMAPANRLCAADGSAE